MDQTNSAPTVASHNAALHDDVRPAWSADVVSWLLGSPSCGHRLAVLDLGAGAGLGTRTIATLGHVVTAVDTADDMLSVLRKVRKGLPHRVAERIPLGNWSVDAITCLQAWHWVDPARAMAECDRVLRPNGMVGLAGHTWDRASEWLKALAANMEPGGTPLTKPEAYLQSLADGAPLNEGFSPSTTNCRSTNCNLPAHGLSSRGDPTNARSWRKSVAWVNKQRHLTQALLDFLTSRPPSACNGRAELSWRRLRLFTAMEGLEDQCSGKSRYADPAW
ncbi:class I SAM-dependent methyltransferase [Pseudarthrobacter sp. Y6]|uniref:class I SAM-dependent methyltransferase n=1 Tax=Pseudarthrobacter sp. Y6 TaxID=3418422 RepID=UPI003CEFF1E3